MVDPNTVLKFPTPRSASGGAQLAPSGPPPAPVRVVGPVQTAPPPPDFKVVYKNSPRRVDAISTDVALWPNGKPLSVHVVNGTDATVRIRLQIRAYPNQAQAMAHPTLEFDVGASDHEHPSVSPQDGHSWGPYAWCEAQWPNGAPTMGDLEIALESPGGA